MYGNPETTTGGNALKFYSTIRLDIRKTSAIKQGENILGNRTRVKVVKNKIAPPFKTIEFDIMFGEGISKLGSLIDMAADAGIVKKSGSWYSFNDERLGQGRENAKTYLMENEELVKKIEEEVRTHFGLSGDQPSEEKTEEE